MVHSPPHADWLEVRPIPSGNKSPELPCRGVEGSWPLRVASHGVAPVELDLAWAGKVHLAERAAPGHGAAGAKLKDGADGASQETGSPATPVDWTTTAWQSRTLCGRTRGALVDEGSLDLLGEDRGLLCRGCWRTVEGWLTPPPATAGEDDVVAWVLSAVLETGEALLEGVPVPRLEWLRRRTRSELKATLDGSVRTTKVGEGGLWVWSGLVNGAKTPEAWQDEMRAAVDRMEALDAGQAVAPARSRKHWSEITSDR
jgi:hypothetical protein